MDLLALDLLQLRDIQDVSLSIQTKQLQKILERDKQVHTCVHSFKTTVAVYIL